MPQSSPCFLCGDSSRHGTFRPLFRRVAPYSAIDSWRVGEPVPIAIVLENEAGVRVREPHSHSVWREPESETIRQGKRSSIPLRVALEGDGAEYLFLSAESCLDVVDDQRGGCTTSGLVLDLLTGKAEGWVTVSPLCPARKAWVIPLVARDDRAKAKNAKRAAGVGAAASGAGGGSGDGGGGGDNKTISLAIAFAPEWIARLNRPMLPLESLPLRIIGTSTERPLAHGGNAAWEARQPTPTTEKQSAARGADVSSWPTRDGACNVRRLLFEVHDCYPRRLAEESIIEGSWRPTTSRCERIGSAAEPEPEHNAGTAPEQSSARERQLPIPSPSSELSLSEAAEEQPTNTFAATTVSTNSTGIAGGSVGGRSGNGGNKDKYTNKNVGLSADYVIDLSVVESASLGGYFGKVWDCSLALGAFVASLGPRSMEGRRVVELGAGCGVVSTVCAALGAAEVVATDTSDLLPLLRLNMERVIEGCRGVQVEEYTWGSPTRDRQALAREKFDVIIGSDLLFDPAYWEPLKDSFSMLNGGRSSVIYLAHRTRNVQEREFFSLLKGFRCRRVAFEEQGTKSRGEERHRVDVERDGLWNPIRWTRGCFPDVALYELRPIVSVGDATQGNDWQQM